MRAPIAFVRVRTHGHASSRPRKPLPPSTAFARRTCRSRAFVNRWLSSARCMRARTHYRIRRPRSAFAVCP